MTDKYSGINSKAGIDWTSVFIFIALMFIGWINIFATTCDLPFTSFEFGSKYCMQLLWMGLSLFVGMLILLSSDKYYYIYSYPAYVGALLLLILTLFVGRTVNGSRSWLSFGPVAIQTAELMKLAACLAVARYMSEYNFSLKRPRNVMVLCGLLLLPIMIILLQNDTGSGLVLGAFLFVLYREGLSKYIYFPVIFTIVLFVVSFIFSPVVIFTALLVLFTLYSALKTGAIAGHFRFLCGMLLAAMLIAMFTPLSGYASLMIVCGIGAVLLAAVALKTRTMMLLWPVLMFVYAMLFVPTTDMLFSHLEEHQKNRILTFVGLVDDPQGVGYNVNQSQIAIGSGGMWGKGFMEGTQIKYDFVPEKHTDFIFCIVGEEWGFFGAFIVLSLYIALILRLMRMGERIKEPFGRVYCYSVAAILLLHVLVNIGMTIGIMPVMGIPLPLMSYGGSSLVAFTLLIMIAIRLDASTSDNDIYF